MSTIQLYGLKKCSTCVNALKWLQQRNIAVEFIDYRDHPVPPATLQVWAEQLGGYHALVNRASTSWRGLTDEQKAAASPEQWLALIAQFPTLIKRPVLLRPDGQVSVGYSEKKYGEYFV